MNGSDTCTRRPPFDGRHPDQRLEERGAAADGGKSADRRDADAYQPAAPQRHRHHGRPLGSARRRHRAQRRPRGERPQGAGARAFRPPAGQHPGALRPGAQDACRRAGAGAAGGARRRSRGLAARRLRHRHPAGGSAPQGAGTVGRRDRAQGRLRPCPCAPGPDRRRDRVPDGVGRGDGEPHDGGGAGQGRDPPGQRGARAGVSAATPW